MSDATQSGPLSGISVLSLAGQYPGPFATMILTDLGADVILLERPDGGDPSRLFPAFFDSLNRGKRSVAIDLKSTEGRNALLQLAAGCDVFLDGFRPGTLERLRVGFEDVQRVNPDVVYVAISGFGQHGERRDDAGHDVTYQALSGTIAGLAGPGRAIDVGTLQLGDLSAALFATIAVLVGLVQRTTTGGGGLFDVALSDCLVALLTTQLGPLLNGAERYRLDSEPGYGLFETQSGTLAVGVAHEDHFWARLCSALGLTEQHGQLGHDERVNRSSELADLLGSALASRSAQEWEAILLAADVPAAAVRTVEEVAADTELARRMFVSEAPDSGARRYVRQPLKLAGTDEVHPRRSPGLGEHTRLVLTELGYHDSEIDELARAGVLAI